MSTHRTRQSRRFHTSSAALFETLESRLLLSGTACLLPVLDVGSSSDMSSSVQILPISTSTDVQPTNLASLTPDCDSDPIPPPDDPTPTPSAIPSRLTIQSPSSTSIFLSWTESSGDADSFDILRLGPTGGWKTIATIDGGRTHYTDTGLQPGATYSYAIDAENEGGDSGESSTISITLPAVTDPTLIGQFGKLPGGGASVPLNFFDTDGTKVTLALSGPGIGVLHLTSAGYDLSLTGTTSSSHLTITTAKTRTPTDDGRFDLADITVGDPTNAADNTGLASLTAATTDLAGDLTITGSLSTLKLGNVADGVITIGALATPTKSPSLVSLTFAQVDDVTLTSAIGIKQLTAQSWLSGQITASTLTTLSITGKGAAKGATAIAGNFGANLTLLGAPGAKTTLNKATVANQITASAWQIDGAVNTLAVGSIGTDWTLNLADASASAGNLHTLTLSAKAATSNDLDLTANAIGTLTVQGNLANSTLALRQAVNPKALAITQMTIHGQFSDSALRTVGNMGSITVGSLDHTLLFAGISSTTSTLPTTSADFVASASITALKITTLTNSDIAAGSILRAALPKKPTAVIDADQSGSFGFATLMNKVRNYQGPPSTGDYIAGTNSALD